MILVVGGRKGGGQVCAHHLRDRGHEVEVMGRGDETPREVPRGIAFYQRDRQNEWEAGVEATKRIAHECIKRGMVDGSMVLIGSVSMYEDDGTSAEYKLTKTAMKALMKQWAEEWKPQRVRVNMVSPGDFRRGPMTATDVAEVVMFLLSGRAKFITGQEIIVRA